MLRRLVGAFCLVVVAGAFSAAAQGTTSRVLGVVTDSSGGVVPGATVTLTNESTGVSFNTVTSGAGTYTFEAIQVGTYTVTVELQGFKKSVSRGNAVNISEPTTINVKLESGGITEEVDVRAAAPIVETGTSGNIGTTFEQKTIESLPIIGGRGRNVLDLVLTQPGVVSGANTGGGVHVNGARDRSWNYTLDGIDNNESSAGGSNFAPLRTNPDSLAEFRVLTGNVTADLGRNSGGQVTMVTRSGTNTFSGTAYYFDRRPQYNANEWENNLQHVPKSNFTQEIPGFSLGGPIKRNNTFFFVNSQWLRLDRTVTQTNAVYTEQARRGIWRYSTVGRNQIAGVSGASVDVNGNPIVPIGTYDIAANDPQHRGLDPSIQAFIGETPLPNTFNLATDSSGRGMDGLNVAGYTWQAPEQERQNDWVTKIDHVFSPRHSAFVRIAKGYQNTLCDTVNGGLAPFPGVSCLVNTKRSPYNVAGNWRWNPGSNTVNEFVSGVNHFTFDFITPEANPAKFSYVSFQVQPPHDYEVGNLRTIDTYQFVDNLSHVRGAHTLKFGTNMRFQRHTDERGSVAGLDVAPWADFSTNVNSVDPTTFGIPSGINTTFDRPALQTGINTLLGRVGNLSQGFVQRGDSYAPGGTTFLFKAWFPEIDVYAQDTWKPKSNLTVDAGVRWEGKLHPTNPAGLIRVPNQRVAVGAPPSNTLKWVAGDLYKNDLNNFGPSVGVAWDPGNDGKSAVRANYRIAYDRINTFLLSSSIFQSIPGITTGVVNTSFGQAGGRLRDGLPSLAPTASPGDFLQPAISGNSIRVVDPQFQSPLTHEWTISYQHQVLGKSMLEVAYVGRRAQHLFGAYNANQVDYTSNGFLAAFNAAKNGGESALLDQLLGPDTRRNPGESGAAMLRRLFASNLQLNSVAATAASLGTRIQGGKTLSELAGLGSFFFFPYPQFLNATSGVVVIDSNDYSRYHALETKLERRFGNGVGYFVGYTFSRSKDTRSFDPAFTVVSTGNSQSAGGTPFDIHNRSLNYALSDFDRTHVFQGQIVWELPFGHGRQFATNASSTLDAIVSGWQLASQVVVESGRPMTVYAGSNTFTNVVQTPANCTGCSSSLGSVHQENGIVFYFSPEERAKFSTPDPGQFSNVGRNFFRGPMFSNVNLTVSKRTRVHNAQFVEFRADATNLLNHPSFGFPTLTMTSGTFGRVFNSVASSARQIQLGVKYSF
jgi:carboxypeptidase family protein